MKKKFTSMACGIAAASILSLALTACDNDSPSAPTGGDEKSSAVENSDAGDVSSSSDKVVASSDAGDVSSSSEGATVRCDALSTECGYTEEEPPCPVNVYGQTMTEGEKILAEEDPYAVTLRI